MEIFWLQVGAIKIAPFAVNITGVKAVDASVLFRFSGGFVAGLLLVTLAFVILKLYKKRTQSVFFWMFSITLGFAFVGFTESIVEGFFVVYHRTVGESVFIFFPH